MKTKILLKARWLLCGLLAVFLTTNAWADEGVYKTALFGSSYNSKGVSGYTDTWTATNDGFTVSLSNFNNNNNGWAFVKCGRKNNASVGTIITDAAIDKAVTKVVVTIDAITASKVNSIKLYRSTNKTNWTEESSFTAATGAQEVAIVSANQAANLYYKVEFDCASGSSNGLVTVSKVEYYAEVGGGGSSETTVKTLKSIAVEGMTTSYEVGDAFSFDGTCTATYSVTKNDVAQADEEKIVTPTSVSAPDMSTTGTKEVTVTYTEDEVERSTTYNITVAAAEGDKLTVETTGVTGTSYADWEEVAGASGAVYAGQSAGGNESIQLRSKNSNSGIISTTSGGLIKKVKVVWNSNTSDGAVLNVYGSNTAYTAASDLYGDNKGTLLGTIVYGTSTQLEITDDYGYVGVRSNSGAMYLTSITFVWEAGKQLESIAVKTNPDKVSYNIGDAFDAAGLVITASYDNSTSEDIAYADNEGKFSFSGFSSAAAEAEQVITVTYGGKSTTFNVEIKDVTLQSVTVSGTPTTTSYTAGDAFDPEGLTVMGHYSDNSEAEITSGITWSYPDANSTLIADQTSIRVVATVEEIASAAYTVNGLTVAAAPLVASWVASEHYSATTDMTAETVAFGPGNNFSLVFDAGTNTQNAPKYYTTGEAVRAYGGNTFALSSSDFKFKEIVISFSSGEGSNDITTNVGTYDAGTWTGNSKDVTFTIGGTSGHRRIASITVTYAEALPSVETPTFSVAEGTYFDAQNVTITTATAGATIYYTTDGTEPTTGSSVYSDPIAVSTNMTIKAIAVKDGLENSEVASATYAMGPIFASLEDLVAADLTSNTMVKVSFTNVAIKKIDTNKKYVTFDIQKEEKDIEIYCSAETLPTTWVVGGTLSGTILAPWKRFSQSNNLVCWELAPESSWQWTDLTYNSPITKTIDHVTVTGTATKTEYVDGEVFDPAGLIVTLYYTDETSEVVTEGITWAPTTALTVGMTSVDVTATVENTTSAVYPVSITVSEIPTKTIAEFIAAGGGRCYLVGVVSNLTNNNKNCTLTDNSGEILLYNISQNGAVTNFVTLEVEEGDRIKVIATTYQVYNQKDEVVAPEFVKELAPEVVAVTGVTVAPTTATVKVGKTVALTATVLPALATNTNVTWESDNTEVATVDENGVVTGVAEGTAQITVTTEENNSFTATATITVEAAPSFTGGEWVLVTDVAQLNMNDYIIIASSEYNKAMSSTQNDNNRGEADVTIAGGILTYESAPAIFTLKEGNAEGQYAFYDEDVNGYLFAASSSKNYLRTQAMIDANASWEITITDGAASVVAQGTNTHNLMQYNNSSKIFSCYETAQQAVGLYKYYSTPLPRYTVTFTANGGTGDAPVVADQLEGAKFNLPSNTYTYAGHQFTGWNDGTTTYAAGASYTMPATNVTFTAQWETVCAWATVYTSNVVFTGTGSYETNSYVKIGGVDYDAQKVGATDKDGSVVVTVPAGAHTLHFHAAAWNGSSVTIKASGVENMNMSSFAIAGDAGVKSSGTYTLANDPVDQHFHFTFDAVTETTEITFSKKDGNDRRFVMYGINQEGGPELQSITIGGNATNTEYVYGQTFNPAGLTVSAVYRVSGVDQDPVDVTDRVVWTFDPAEFNSTSQTSVTATATFETKSASKTVDVTVSEPATPNVTYTAIVVKKGDKYYAMGQTLSSSGALNAVELEDVVNGKMVNVPVEDRTALTWIITETEDGATFQAQNGKYLSGTSSNSTDLSFSTEPVVWAWNDTYGCYAIGGRSFYMYNSTTQFKNFALSNMNNTPSQCSSKPENLSEYIDIDNTKEIVTLRSGLENGKIGTMCWNAAIYEVEGAYFFEPEAKMEDGVCFAEAAKKDGVYPAGKPYVFQATGEEIRAVVSKNNTTTVAGTNKGLHGTFERIDVPNGEGYYIIYQNKLYTANNNYIEANRAYIDKSQLPGASSNPAPGRRRLVIGRDNLPTGVDAVVLDGEQVQKVLIDGQIYIVRDGKMYDLTGRMIR